MIYDVIIIGAGAAGLFAGASFPVPVKGLVIEKTSSPGKKLLMSGAGQCNITHGGDMKDFIPHYGENGGPIRSVLYQFNNLSLMAFLENQGVPLFEREDGKVFPKSLQAKDVLNALVACCKRNGLEFLYSSPVQQISFKDLERIYRVQCGSRYYEARKLIVATGGCSYPTTGSDGSLFPILKKLKVEIKPTRPALVPVFVENYPYEDLSGISFPSARITILPKKKNITDALLLTHRSFSGPAPLNLSRYLEPGQKISLNYHGAISYEKMLAELAEAFNGNSKQLLTALYSHLNPLTSFPKRFLEAICRRCNIDPAMKASQLSKKDLQAIASILTRDAYSVSGLGGYNTAMVTAGGVALTDVHVKTMESKNNPGLYFAGEVLDIDGDTGGYNLQFAFSSGYLAAKSL